MAVILRTYMLDRIQDRRLILLFFGIDHHLSAQQQKKIIEDLRRCEANNEKGEHLKEQLSASKCSRHNV
jgi:hypothetical protein